jgi:hypothetical protein
VTSPVDGSIVSSDPTGLMPMGGERRARFRILCESSFGYTMTLPLTVTLTKEFIAGPPTSDQQLTADTFRGAFDGFSSFSSGALRYCDEQTDSSYGTDNEDILWVGGTLNIKDSNETGIYFGTAAVTVAYQ